jgi:hypothetical protein
MAVANPTRETTEAVAEVMRLLEELPAEDRPRFVEDVRRAVEEALRERRYRIFSDVLQGWHHLALARRDPDYRKNMARGDEPLGETYTLEEIKQRFRARPDR